MYGPLPIGFLAKPSTPTSFRYWPGSTEKLLASTSKMRASVLDRTSRTAIGPLTWISLTAANTDVDGALMLGSSMWSMLAFTSSAVTVWPLWNFTPERNLKSIVLSSTTFHDSARPGTILPSQSRSTSESKTLSRTEMPTSWLEKYGCGLSISEMVSSRNVPVRAGAAVVVGLAAAATVVAAGAVVAATVGLPWACGTGVAAAAAVGAGAVVGAAAGAVGLAAGAAVGSAVAAGGAGAAG